MLQSTNGTRSMPMEEFFLGMLETALEPGEILAAIQIPLFNGTTAGAYEKFSIHERPTATVAAVLEVRDGGIVSPRLAVGSVGPRPVRITSAEEILTGQAPEEDLFRQAGQAVAEAVDPVDDLYGSADYKRHLSSVLTAKVLQKATEASEKLDHGN